MLKQRVVTALVLALLVLGAIFGLRNHNQWFALVMLVPVLAGSWEWSNFMSLRLPSQRVLYVLLVAVCLLLCWWIASVWVVILSSFWWILALYFVIRYPAGTNLWVSPQALGAIGLLVLVPTWLGIVLLQGSVVQGQDLFGPWFLLYVMSLVWGADTGAYFAGRKWGRAKLAPSVSPGKSIAGLLGGLAAAALLALGVGVLSPASDHTGLVSFLIISMVTTLASVLGDLLESMVKRHRGVKDSGNILPGHGGVMDRIDSLTAAVPVFVAGMYLIT